MNENCPPPLLVGRQLNIGYRLKKGTKGLLDLLDLVLESGQLVGLLGRNGTGKSTLIKTLAGLLKPLSGKLDIMGIPAYKLKQRAYAKMLSIVLTRPPIVGNMLVKDLVATGRYPHTTWLGNLTKTDLVHLEQTIKVTRLADFRYTTLASLSDGERQRALIARALAQDTPLLFLDEPTAFLDTANSIEIMLLLKEIAHKEHKGVLVATHDLPLALQLADKIWLINANNQLHSALPEDIILSGMLDHIFANDNFYFDKQRGHFLINTTAYPWRVVGESIAVIWTKRAFDKHWAGQPHKTAIFPEITVIKHMSAYQWQLTGYDAQRFATIATLLAFLETL